VELSTFALMSERRQPFLRYDRPMTDNRDLCVEVRHQDIVVTMPGTSLRVVYV
jgi:hypothetical protein